MAQDNEVTKFRNENIISLSRKGARLMVVIITTDEEKGRCSLTKHLHKAGDAYRDSANKLYELVR